MAATEYTDARPCAFTESNVFYTAWQRRVCAMPNSPLLAPHSPPARSARTLLPSVASLARWPLCVRDAIAATFRTLFVPRGAVPAEYVRFQAADSVQAMASYLRGILSLQATLTGAGFVAAESSGASMPASSVLPILLAFVLKDGAAMLGSLLFSYGFAVSFDTDVRFWRLFADVINDVGLTVELLAPLTGPHYFLLTTCAANVCKSLCGVAAGATRVAISNHFARDGNVAEVQAKESAQETALSLLGLLAGVLLVQHVDDSPALKWIVFAALTLLHIVANYYAVSILSLRTLNRSRMRLLVMDWWSARAASVHAGAPTAALRSSQDVAQCDAILPATFTLAFPRTARAILRLICPRRVESADVRRIQLGVPISHLAAVAAHSAHAQPLLVLTQQRVESTPDALAWRVFDAHAYTVPRVLQESQAVGASALLLLPHMGEPGTSNDACLIALSAGCPPSLLLCAYFCALTWDMPWHAGGRITSPTAFMDACKQAWVPWGEAALRAGWLVQESNLQEEGYRFALTKRNDSLVTRVRAGAECIAATPAMLGSVEADERAQQPTRRDRRPRQRSASRRRAPWNGDA